MQIVLNGTGADDALYGALVQDPAVLKGLDTSAVGYALAVATLAGFAGAGAATALNVRWDG